MDVAEQSLTALGTKLDFYTNSLFINTATFLQAKEYLIFCGKMSEDKHDAKYKPTDPSTDRPTNGIRSKNCATGRFGFLPL